MTTPPSTQADLFVSVLERAMTKAGDADEATRQAIYERARQAIARLDTNQSDAQRKALDAAIAQIEGRYEPAEPDEINAETSAEASDFEPSPLVEPEDQIEEEDEDGTGLFADAPMPDDGERAIQSSNASEEPTGESTWLPGWASTGLVAAVIVGGFIIVANLDRINRIWFDLVYRSTDTSTVVSISDSQTTEASQAVPRATSRSDGATRTSIGVLLDGNEGVIVVRFEELNIELELQRRDGGSRTGWHQFELTSGGSNRMIVATGLPELRVNDGRTTRRVELLSARIAGDRFTLGFNTRDALPESSPAGTEAVPLATLVLPGLALEGSDTLEISIPLRDDQLRRLVGLL